MMVEFHFIRPYWWLACLPLIALACVLFSQKPALKAWKEVCDTHLLNHLIQNKGHGKRFSSLMWLFICAFFMIIGLAGPTWSRLPVPTYKQMQPRVVVLDMSDAMMADDLKPNRLSRAKFKLHDLFSHQNTGQFGLVVYSGEPFIVSPLTDDGQTIDALLLSLTMDTLPIRGERLETALAEAGKLITQAGFQRGEILVLTAVAPSSQAIDEAKTLAGAGIHTSIMPVLAGIAQDSDFLTLAKAGRGIVVPFADTSDDLEQWLSFTQGSRQFSSNLQDEIGAWRDQGRWFLLVPLLFLLPVFRRGWLQRVST